jgi:two-component system response regulator FixJ
VHVIDDDDAMRDSLGFLLKTSGMRAEIHASAHAFLERFDSAGASCVVTDMRMPEMSGIDLLRRVKEKSPRIPVIVITGHGDVALAVEAMKLGADDFLEKPFDDEALLSAIRAALERDRDREGEESRIAELRARVSALSAREREVLERLVAGHPNKIIAYDLGISHRTVEVYRANVMSKMQAGSLSDLVRMALLAGMGTEPPEKSG